jgi:PAT family beta-lactamase induction signal transducer AmpG
VANASTGFIVEAVGWTLFFVICVIAAIPGMLLLLKVAPWTEKTRGNSAEVEGKEPAEATAKSASS